MFLIITPALLARFLFFWLVERGRNILQFTYLMAWWRHYSVIIHVTKVYLYSQFSKLNTLSLKTALFFTKNLRIWKFFCQKTDKRTSYQKNGKYEYGRLSAKVVNNWFDRTHCDDWLQNVLCLYVVLVLLGSVETQLGWSGKFY